MEFGGKRRVLAILLWVAFLCGCPGLGSQAPPGSEDEIPEDEEKVPTPGVSSVGASAGNGHHVDVGVIPESGEIPDPAASAPQLVIER